MRSLVLTENGKFQIQNKELDFLDNTQCRVRITKSGICSSDIQRSHENGAYNYPLIMGHELVGEISEIGKCVNGFSVGDRVAISPLLPCFKCDPCNRQIYAQCYNYSYYGSRIDGGFAEYLDVSPWNLVLIPDNVEFKDAVALEPMAVVVHALKRIGLLTAESNNTKNVVIIGAGFLGLLMVQILNKINGLNVTIVDKNMFKLKIASNYNCDFAHINSKDEWHSFIRLNSFDYVLEATGNPNAFNYSIELVVNGGNILWMGNITGDLTISKRNVSSILRKEVAIIGTWNSTFIPNKHNDWIDSIKFIQDGIHPGDLVTHEVTLEQVPNILRKMYDHKTNQKLFEYIRIIVNNQNS